MTPNRWDHDHRRMPGGDRRQPFHRVDASEISLGDVEPGMSERALQAVHADPFARAVDGESVAEGVRAMRAAQGQATLLEAQAAPSKAAQRGRSDA